MLEEIPFLGQDHRTGQEQPRTGPSKEWSQMDTRSKFPGSITGLFLRLLASSRAHARLDQATSLRWIRNYQIIEQDSKYLPRRTSDSSNPG